MNTTELERVLGRRESSGLSLRAFGQWERISYGKLQYWRRRGSETGRGRRDSGRAVSKYVVRHRKAPSQTWRTFLKNHAKEIVSIDSFTVPTVTFRVLFVFLVLSNDRRRVVHFNVTDSPSAVWAGQQVIEAFPWDTAPKFMIRDRDGIYGDDFVRRVGSKGIEQVVVSARSPWQNPFVERLVGSIRRECLDHTIVFNERHVRRLLKEYFGLIRTTIMDPARPRTGKGLPGTQTGGATRIRDRRLRADGRWAPSSVFPTRCLSRCLSFPFYVSGLLCLYARRDHVILRLPLISSLSIIEWGSEGPVGGVDSGILGRMAFVEGTGGVPIVGW